MYLKRLEIAGFKSFASRTVFEFGPGITAIIGPNGSGKSNIAEALRWVLGEQSTRLLRARKTEEVIFAGSQRRPPAERAEVSIVLEDQDGGLPFAASEVIIARRAYRTGESDYFINGRRVRLRDVQELLLEATGFAGSGSSYAFIGQGAVEAFLQMRPAERRQLIEEAADVQRYRWRLDAARSHLDAAGEARERLQMLLDEISPRLAQLERQARRAAEHARLSRELQEALRSWYGAKWRQLQGRLLLAREALQEAEATEARLRGEAEGYRRELAAVEGEVTRLRAAVREAAERLQRLREALHQQEQRVALAQQRLAMLRGRREELAEELAALQEERRAAAPPDEGRRREEELRAAMAQAAQELARERERLQQVEGEWQELLASLRSARERAERLRTAAAEAARRAERLRSSHGEGNRRLAAEEGRRRQLVRQMAQTVQELRGLREEDSVLQAQAEALAQRVQTLEREAAQVRANQAQVQANQQSRRARLEELRSRLQFLQEVERRLYPEGAQPEEGVLVPGLEALLYRVLQVPPGLARAIEAALGECLEAVLVPTYQDAVAGAGAIAGQGMPRTYVVPLQGLRPAYPLSVLKEKGIIGVAARLVRCDPRYRPVVDALLGRVIVVKDLEVAQRVARRGLGTVVTLDGIVFHPWGAISAGQPRSNRPFPLRADWDREGLTQEVQRLSALLEVGQRELERLQGEAREREEALAGLRAELAALTRQRQRLGEETTRRRQRLAQMRGEMRGLVSSLARLREEDQEALGEARDLEERSKALLEEAAEAEGLALQMQRAQELMGPRRQEALAAVAAASARLAGLERELAALEEERQRRRQQLARMEERTRAKEGQLRHLEQEMAAIAAALEADGRRLEGLRRELEAATAQAPPGEALAQAEARERELRARLMSVQETLIQAERRLAEAGAEVRHLEAEAASLRQRLQEEGLQVDLPALPLDDGQPGQVNEEELAALEQRIERLRGQLRRLGSVNPEAEAEYGELRERHDGFRSQMADLEGAAAVIGRAMETLEEFLRQRFRATFQTVSEGFSRYFRSFMPGGEARLVLTEGEEPGVEMVARPPGKRVRTLNQLSGGERSLTAMAYLFALLEANPWPFCVLDEADAMLDEANVGRFAAGLRELASQTQFIVITHNRRTIEAADAVYGISMGPDGASRVISLRLSEVAAAEA